MNDTPARLLTLLSLLQTPREWPGGELADRLGVSPRTIRRDVDRLRALGYPVESTMGPAGGYRLVAGTAMPPLLLDDEEAVAIAVGLRGTAGNPVAGIEEASARALAKLEQVLPSRLRRRVTGLHAATVPLAPLSGGSPVDPAVLAALAAAVEGRERIRFAYQAHDGTATRRLAEPHRLVATGRRWYLVAYDADRGDWRVFRADRVSEVHATGVRVAPREPPAADAAEFVRARLYGLAPVHEATVTVRLPADLARRHLGGHVEPLGEDRCRVRMGADTIEYLAFHLIQLGCPFEVHDPPELRAHLRAVAARARDAAGPA
ncbi:helix-turn-helix transcriptional regulator [Bailinhaonella thermotolerans]|uniref:YafY family transcriptional regulator n=1 Tax=Bailinhaonella thermotolerans TaxID=1070861 RepID=A0A3A4AMS1_9ACTN|nr:YafY family protein [Bailinhaonella thermotolerans]RJL27113.1 YafY family transcriptional regulator [Bailinhaonella thermotolerans]